LENTAQSIIGATLNRKALYSLAFPAPPDACGLHSIADLFPFLPVIDRSAPGRPTM
jgi:hypothetical protein